MKTIDLNTGKSVPFGSSYNKGLPSKRGTTIWDSATQGTRATGYKANRLRLGLTKKQRAKAKRLLRKQERLTK